MASNVHSNSQISLPQTNHVCQQAAILRSNLAGLSVEHSKERSIKADLWHFSQAEHTCFVPLTLRASLS